MPPTPAAVYASQAMDVTVEDLLPLIAKLSPEERRRLSRMALLPDPEHAATAEASPYEVVPGGSEEFAVAEDPLSWDAEGWDAIL